MSIVGDSLAKGLKQVTRDFTAAKYRTGDHQRASESALIPREGVGQLSKLGIGQVRFVKELYPRLKQDDAAIERYRAAVGLFPPITVARDGVLVDGYHRWQAQRLEGLQKIEVENLGDLADIEILKESIRRNATHGKQLETTDKKRLADQLYRQGMRDSEDLMALLSITKQTLDTYLREARHDEKETLKAKAWDLWLDCLSEREIAEAIGVPQPTLSGEKGWLIEKRNNPVFNQAPESRQHFDIWQFPTADGDSHYFGRMPPQVVENLLWLFTEPGDIVVDPFAGGGTTIAVAKAMGRRVWASDLVPSGPLNAIHRHDILEGWPKDAPSKAKLVLLDPPYWQQAKGKYSNDERDLSNMPLEKFYASWAKIMRACAGHIAEGGCIAYIISPTQQEDGTVIDHATDMLAAATRHHLHVTRRIIVPYQTQQATGQQVTWAREQKKLLKLYRDLVLLSL